MAAATKKSTVLIQQFDIRQTRKNENFASLSVNLGRDENYRTIDAKIWQFDRFANDGGNRLAQGDIIEATYREDEYQGRPQWIIENFKIIEAEDRSNSIGHFIRPSSIDQDFYDRTLQRLLEEVDRNRVSAKILHSFFDDADFRLGFMEAPAATRHHQAYAGGLFEHTLNVTCVALALADVYSNGKQKGLTFNGEPLVVDRTLLASAGLLHDLGKIQTYRLRPIAEATDANRFEGHLPISYALILIVGSILAARRLTLPLVEMRVQADQMAAGNLDGRVSVKRRDEVRELADAFNTLADRLQETYRRLETRIEENRLRADYINVINGITRTITQTLDLDSIFEILKRDLGKILNYDGLWIALADNETGKLEVTHSDPASLLDQLREGKVPMEAPDEEDSPSVDSEGHGVDSELGYASYLVAPLPSVQIALGTLTVASKKPEAYGERETDILTSVAAAVAVGIEQADLFARTKGFAQELEKKVEERTLELGTAHRKLMQTEKYAATGRLAANLAHEINNPLGIIKNYLRLLTDRMKQTSGGRRDSDPTIEHFTIINEEIGRIARIVRQLLDLHRPPDQTVIPTNIASILRDLIALMEDDLAKDGIEVELRLESRLPQPIVSPDLVRQVFMNLLRNAQDAMEEGGGKLSITAKATEILIEDEQGENKSRPGVVVAMEDTGCGIAANQIDHIFDPFYTTKSSDKGTGLGLAVSFGIVQSYHGSFDVRSEAGKGTTFTVTLPVEPPQDPFADIDLPETE